MNLFSLRIYLLFLKIKMKKVKPKKYLGQHFLNDENISQKIVQLLENKQNYFLEIGPGTGVLTKYLIKKNSDFSLIEIDSECVNFLVSNYPKTKNKILEIDFLKLNLANNFPKKISVIGNFPYNISSQIFFKILENKNQIIETVGMVQMEVAERIVALSGKKRGILSVFTQAFYNIKYCMTVNPNVFIPPPKVKSAVIKLTRNDRTSLACDENLFFKIVKTAFNQRRKTLKNALKTFILQNTFEVNNLLKLRAEDLSVEDFITLTFNAENN